MSRGGAELPPQYDAVEVFSATKARERTSLGAQISAWLTERAGTVEIVDTVVRQSSDQQYHCLSVLIFYRRLARPPQGGDGS